MSQTLDRDIPDTDADDIAPPPPRSGADERASPRDDAPPASPFVNLRGAEKPENVQYEIIETDDNGKPLRQAEPRREGGLSTDETDDGTLLEQRQRDDETAKHAEERRHMSADQRRDADRKRRDRQKNGRDRTIAERDELREKVDRLERQLSGVVPRIAAHDRARVQDTLTNYTQGIEAQDSIAAGARQRLAQAMTDQDGDAMAAALEMRDNAIAEKTRLTGEKKALEARVADSDRAGPDNQDDGRRQPDDNRRAPPRPAPLSPRANDRMEDFFDRHSWIDRTNANNPTTQAVLKIDALVASEGFRPESQEYWDAVEDMMAANPRLRPFLEDNRQDDPPPARNTRQQAPAPQRRGPSVGGGSERGSAPPPARAGVTQVHLSPSRKAAMIASGTLSSDGRTVQNQDKFQRQMKSFAAYDAENGQQA